MRETTNLLEAHGIRVIDAREERLSLEDVFIKVVETSRREAPR
jgi:hypothetical protein